MRGRPRIYDLTNQKFGHLQVLGKADDPRLWSCQCDCGSPPVRLKTAQLRWGHRTTCGCGIGRQHGPVSAWPGGRDYRAVLPGLKDMVPLTVAATLGPAEKRACAACGHVPGKFLAPVFGVLDDRFKLTLSNPDCLLSLCLVCYERARATSCSDMRKVKPEAWVASLVPENSPLPEGMRGLARLLVEYQTEEERVSLSGMTARARAEALLSGGSDVQ